MAEKSQACERRCGPHVLSGITVGFAWLRVVVRMVVGEGEGAAVVPQDRVEDFPHRYERSVDRTLGDNHRSSEAVRRVTDEHEQALTPGAVELLSSNPRHVLRSAERRLLQPFSGSSGELEGSDERGGFGWADPGSHGEFLRQSSRQGTYRSILGKQLPSKVERAHALCAVAQNERQQLTFRQCVSAA